MVLPFRSYYRRVRRLFIECLLSARDGHQFFYGKTQCCDGKSIGELLEFGKFQSNHCSNLYLWNRDAYVCNQ